MTTDEIQAWAAEANGAGLLEQEGMERRGQDGDPRAMFITARNDEEAVRAMEIHSIHEKFIRTTTPARAHLGRSNANLIAVTVREGDETMTIAGVSQSVRKQGIGHRSLTLTLSKQDVRALARTLLAMSE